MPLNIYDIPVKSIDGSETTLAPYKEKILVIVNTASKCGFTPQYKELEELYKKYNNELVILGFPCNQFGSQEPGTENDIQEFCELNFGVSFPLFSKIDVNGNNTHPLYKELKSNLPGLMGSEKVKWNFTKFLIGPNGIAIKRFAPQDGAEKIEKEIAKLVSK